MADRPDRPPGQWSLFEAHAVALAGEVVVAQQQGEKEVVLVDP
jgi:hypothetical protein